MIITIKQKSDSELRAEWRPTAKLSKGAFFINCKSLGVLPVSEAKQGAKGIWPASFNDVLAALSLQGVSADDAEIMLSGAATFERMDPFILAVQAVRGMTDQEVDALFGWNNG